MLKRKIWMYLINHPSILEGDQEDPEVGSTKVQGQVFPSLRSSKRFMKKILLHHFWYYRRTMNLSHWPRMHAIQ